MVSLETNLGYTRAVNVGARRAEGERLVLLNDDCVCDPGFVEAITAPIDPAAGVVMAAAVMRDWADRSLIDSAGMELDRTLLVWDYLNGAPLTVLERRCRGSDRTLGGRGGVRPLDLPRGRRLRRAPVRLLGGRRPCPATSFPRAALRARPGRDRRPRAFRDARFRLGVKNYLTGLRARLRVAKWQGDDARARLGPVLVRELATCAGQAVVDRNLAGVRGRVKGYHVPRGASATRPISSTSAPRRTDPDDAPSLAPSLAAAGAGGWQMIAFGARSRTRSTTSGALAADRPRARAGFAGARPRGDGLLCSPIQRPARPGARARDESRRSSSCPGLADRRSALLRHAGEAIADPMVAIVGCVGSIGARNIAWSEASVTWASFTHRYPARVRRGEFRAFAWGLEDLPAYAAPARSTTSTRFLLGSPRRRSRPALRRVARRDSRLRRRPLPAGARSRRR